MEDPSLLQYPTGPEWIGRTAFEPSKYLQQSAQSQLGGSLNIPITDTGLGLGRIDDFSRTQRSYQDIGPKMDYEAPSLPNIYEQHPGYPKYGDALSDTQRSGDPSAFGRSSPSTSYLDSDYPSFLDHLESPENILEDTKPRKRASEKPHQSQRRANRDEFDGPVQFLKKPPVERIAAQERDLPHVPVNLDVGEQDDVLRKVNGQLSQCAFDFVAKYQFPIPLEPDKRPVQRPSDREWTEWAYLLKRLATKRRIPARVLYNGQIKQLVTILENSLEMRHASAHQSRPPKDDRNVLQLISAGTQVAKMLKDASTMDSLDQLYRRTERLIQDRRQAPNPYLT